MFGVNSLHMLCFPFQADQVLETPEQVKNPEICDIQLGEVVLQLAMLLEDVYIVHGLGCNVLAHSDDDISGLGEAFSRVAKRLKPYL